MPLPSVGQSRHRPGVRLLCCLLSGLIPGTGQMLAGRHRRGAAMLAISLLIIVAGLVIYRQGTSTLLAYLVQPRVLIAVFILNLAVFAFRLGAVIDAFRLPTPDDRPSPNGLRGGFVALALAGVVALTAAPHAVLGYYTYLTYDTLQQVFSVESLADDLEDEMSSPDPTPDDDDGGDDGSEPRDDSSQHGDPVAGAGRARDGPDP